MKKNLNKLNEAIDKLASLVPNGHLLSCTNSTEFMNAVSQLIEELQISERQGWQEAKDARLEVIELRKKLRKFKNAISDHKNNFPDEPLEEEKQLWKVLEEEHE